ncbi:hypothetical protein P3F01_05610 [Clostridium perfringens]|uniref:hypothetical protein n=1 Tax=Clostridium perfringens TaxID=1502 RepID=UPI0028E16A6F|nr:hypothetical protein [Clostridium perfringens]MDT9335859.1 hypothetical protein [Clostridium perfringens]MDT9343616.1 hypothetical protein [Clostridium perfringens]MDT9346797.1 hypothetical protein [Clostridium perfringens]MDT9352702.1 hypothetical protein [Clostridium perfringens]
MALNESSLKKLNSELSSCKNLIDLIKLTKLVNDFTILKLLKLLLILIISISLSIALCYKSNFSQLITTLTDSGLTLSIGLIALIIAGYSIVMGSLSNDNIYYLLLNIETRKKGKSISLYSSTIIKCTEPLIWFVFLLIFSMSFKITYLLKDFIKIHLINLVFFIKIIIIAILLFFLIIAILSLIYFIINMYNVLTANARFELLHRHAKNTGKSFDIILKSFENELNNFNEE